LARKCGIIFIVKRRRSGSMPAVMEAIDRMTISEKFDAMNYLCGCYGDPVEGMRNRGWAGGAMS
jgi:hypothetical protein